jgi:hypothetical protein
MSYYNKIKVESRIAQVFEAYDADNSESIDQSEFMQLIRDLCFIQFGEVTNDIETIAASIASNFHITEKQSFISLKNFIDEVMREDSCFHMLKNVMVSEQYIELLSLRGKVSPRRPFRPTYDYQRVYPHQEPLQFANLEIKLGETKMARISDPMQCQFKIPSIDGGRVIRPYVLRNDTVKQIKEKVVMRDMWPKSHSPPPNVANIDLIFNDGVKSKVLTNEMTAEEINLFYAHKFINVVVNVEPPPSVFKSQDSKANSPLVQQQIYDRVSDRISVIERDANREVDRLTGSLLVELDVLPSPNECGESNYRDLKQRIKHLLDQLKLLKK